MLSDCGMWIFDYCTGCLSDICVYGMSMELWNVDSSLIDLVIICMYKIPQLLIYSTVILWVDFIIIYLIIFQLFP